MISFACPACARVFVVPPQAAGQRGRCPACGAEVTAPHDLQAPTVVGSGVQQSLLIGASAADLARPGARRLGRYLLEAELGRGGMGVVYRATDEHLRRAVAIKTLLAGEDVDAGAVERFRREAEAAARLRHPGIVAVHEVGTGPDGAPFMVMDLVDGQSLAKRVTTGAEDRLPLDDAVRAVRDVVRAIQHAHEQGVLHRDLKPQNVMLDKSGRALVMDFGLAKLQGATQLTREGSMLGTPAYMPPEQVDGIDVDARSDVYSLGATLYHAITGKPPFEAQSAPALIAAVITKEPAPPSLLNRRAQGDLDTICLRALEKEPGRRYPSAAALADDLDRWLEGEPIAARPLGVVGRLARRARRNKLVTGALVTGALALVVGGGVAVAQTLALRQQRREADERERERLTAEAERERERLKAEAEREREHTARLERALAEATAAKARADRTLARVLHDRGVTALREHRDRDAAIYAATALSEAMRVDASSPELASYRSTWVAARQGRWRAPVEVLQLSSKSTTTLAVSADGTLVAVVGTTDAALWDARTGRPRPLAHPGSDWFRSMTFAPDGHLLFMATPRGVLMIDTTGATAPRTINLANASGGLAMSADGRRLGVGLRHGVVIVDLQTGTANQVVPPAGVEVPTPTGLAWSEGQLHLVDGGLLTFDLATRGLSGPLGDDSTVCVATSADGRLVACGTWEGFVRVLTRRPGQDGLYRVSVISAHPTAVRSVAFSRDGALLATRGQEGHVKVWTVAGGLTATLSFRSAPRHVGFLADERLIVSTADGALTTVDLAGTVLDSHSETVRGLSFSPDGTTLASASVDSDVFLWDVAQGPSAVRARSREHVDCPALGVTVESATRFVASLTDGTLRRVDLTGEGGRVDVGTHHPRPANAITSAGTGRVLSGGDELRLWELGAARRVARWSAPHPGQVLGVAADVTRGRAASACADGQVRLFDLETGAPGAAVEGQLVGALAVAFTRDGRLVGGGHDGTLRVWDPETGLELACANAHEAGVWTLAVSQDGLRLATAGAEGTCRLWRLDPLAPLAELSRHVGPVHAVAFSPDGRWLVSAGEDRAVRWWPLEQLDHGPSAAEVLREAQEGTGLVIRVEQGEVDPSPR